MILLFLVFAALLLSCGEESLNNPKYLWTGSYGDNILFQDRTEYNKRDNSFLAEVPAGQSVTIRITGKSVIVAKPGDHVGPLRGIWYYYAYEGSDTGWTASPFNTTDYTQSFTSIAGVQACDTRLQFDEGAYLVEYFEHDLSTPNFTKTIIVKKY